MKLEKLLERISYTIVKGSTNIEIDNLVYDSRKATKGSVFVCMTGAIKDGHDFAEEVVKKGATVLIVQNEVNIEEDITIIKVDNTRLALAQLSAAYFDYPAEKLKTIGITGTKGKTTTSYMVYSVLQKAGIKTGLIGTIESIIGDKIIPADNTTPESYLVQQYFAEMVKEGCLAVVMEVSSQGLMLHRVAGFTFDYGVFTNMEPDHVGPNEHKDFEDYMACKGILFKNCKLGIVNCDDEHMETVLLGHTCSLETFGLSANADLRAINLDLHSKLGNLGVIFDVTGLMNVHVQVNIPGKFSVYNALTAIAICRHFNIDEEIMKQAMLEVRVKGRVEMVPISDRFTLMIDYAHNAMSLNSVLATLKEYKPKRLVCMFGCGGNRSRDRRFDMGEISSNLADLTVVTSDNPRFEKPEVILQDIIVGVKKGKGEYVSIIDRKEAIRYCIKNALDGDVIILAGKGHEDYQEINGEKHHMDERDLIREVIEEMTEDERAKGRIQWKH